eukprot:6695-Heterococcus_DN1.PRE.4
MHAQLIQTVCKHVRTAVVCTGLYRIYARLCKQCKHVMAAAVLTGATVASKTSGQLSSTTHQRCTFELSSYSSNHSCCTSCVHTATEYSVQPKRAQLMVALQY